MNQIPFSTRSARALTSRRGSWLTLGIALVIMTVLFGALSQVTAPAQNAQAAADSESSLVAERLAEFAGADTQSVMVVAARTDGAVLTAADSAELDLLKPTLAEHAAGEVRDPVLSEDGAAVIFITPIRVGETNSDTAETITAMRDALSPLIPSHLDVFVTGGPAFGADVAASFAGADFTLLLVTIVIVALLLIVTYRSPILWLLPLAVVGLADGLAGRATQAASAVIDMQFDSGIISVLVFGAGTNYALLLISRYREELAREENHRIALAEAWRQTLPAILASNITVILALLTLVFAVIPGTRGLGLSSAIGLVIALGGVLFMLPPLLAVCGRGVFWPFIPRPGEAVRSGGVWRAMATRVTTRPVLSLTAALALLAVMATGLIGTTVGLDQGDKFRVQSDSARGLEVIEAHFDAGEAQPIYVVTREAQSPEVLTAIAEVEGVVRAHPVGDASPLGDVKLMVTSAYSPSTPESLTQIVELREAVHAVEGADALVGGAVAVDVDARDGNSRDLLLIAPLVLLVSLIVLVVLLRAVITPLLLLLVNVVSALAAIGFGAWLSRLFFDQAALDLQVPLLSVLFLVALGIDYTIFLVHRARSEAVIHGTKAGMVEAVTHTGGVITSAGIVLAGVFAALGVLPLVTLGQLGLIVGVGVIIDTLVVRTIIVPAIFSLLGDRAWWPSNPARTEVTGRE